MTDVVIPHQGLTVDEAVFLGWLKQVGEPVAEGEPIAEFETDKTTADLASPATGVLGATFVAADDEVAPGQVVGRVDRPV